MPPSMPRSRASIASSGWRIPLRNDRKRGSASEPLETLPGESRIREHAEEVTDCGADVLLGRLLEPGAEDGIGEILGDPDPLQEREICLLEVARLPPGDVVVDRQNQCRVAGGFGPPHDAGG